MESIRKYVRQIISEQISTERVQWYNKKIDEIYEGFQKLEQEYNTYSLDQLKKDYKASIIKDKSLEIKNVFEQVKNLFSQQEEEHEDNDDSYSEIDSRLSKLENLIDSFIKDIESLEEAFKQIGDLDEGSSYFKNPILY